MFAVLAAFYGRHWLDLWEGLDVDAQVKPQWSDALARFDDVQVRAAVEAIKAEGRRFPPSLPEFVALCASFRRKGAAPLSLVPPTARPPAETFQRMRDVLARVKVDKGGV